MPNLNRRGAATLPAIAIPALATEADPIFAAIQRHRDAIKAFRDASDRGDCLDIPVEKRRTHAIAYADYEIVETDDPRWIAAERECIVALVASEEAQDALLEVAPTTVAGAAALLSYAAQRVLDGCEWPEAGYLVENPSCSIVAEYGVGFETKLNEHVAKALAAIA
jgi:hypothetical protein